ncbi:hypothetical protein GEMRC1_010923 [Eukaryota sp. GEM-RC1]
METLKTFQLMIISSSPFPQSELTLIFFAYLKFCLFPTIANGKNLYYAQKVKPLKFLSHAVYINRTIQSFCSIDGKPLKVNNPFPMTKTLVPQHIRLDTAWINQRVLNLKGSANVIRKEVFDSVLTETAITSSRSFGLKYSSIVTDGISCSLVMIRKDLLDKNGNTFEDFTAKPLISSERYIDSLTSEDIEKMNLTEKRIIGIDPNEYDLMFCVSPKTNEEILFEEFSCSDNNPTKKRLPSEMRLKQKGGIKKRKKQLNQWRQTPSQRVRLKPNHFLASFRYSTGERSYDRKSKKYRLTERRKLKTSFFEITKTETERSLQDYTVENSNGRTVSGQEILDEFALAVSRGQQRSCFSDEFETYIKEAERSCVYLSDFYEDDWFTKRKLQIYSNNQQSEKNMLERFKLTYGSPEDLVLGYGDWSSKGNTRKGKTPAIRGAEIRRMLRKFGYKVFLVDEYRTSKSCSKCAAQGLFGLCTNDPSIKVLGPRGLRQIRRKKKKLKEKVLVFNRKDPPKREALKTSGRR